MTLFSRPRAIIVASILAVVAAACYYASLPPAQGLFFFEVTLQSTQTGDAQVFYDTGHQFRESDSNRQEVRAGRGPSVLRFPLPTGKYRALRFDPINRAAIVDFAGACIVDLRGQIIRQFRPESFEPVHEVDSLNPHEGGLRMISTGNDPYLAVEFGGPFALSQGADALTMLRVGLVFLGVFFVLLVAAASPWRPRWPTGGLFTAKPDAWLAGGMLIAVVLKFWLVSSQTLYVLGGAMHDDQLFVDQAYELLHGRWLGSYSQFTLMKGPMYSLFLAGSFLLGVPFFTLLQALYTGACVALQQAVRPLKLGRGIQWALFVVLLFNPVTFESHVHGRLLRQNLIPSLALLVIAALIGLYARRLDRPRRLVPWALGAGVALAAFWLTREESVWILPSAGLIWAAASIAVWRHRPVDRWLRLALFATPAVICALGASTVAWINLRHYGIFTTCEFKQIEFKDGYGALLRIEPRPWRPFIPVTREMRLRLYAVSPAFAELRPYLEGPLGEGWASASESVTHLPARKYEMAGGWFMWALRDAVALAGHCTSGAESMAFYARLAREVNEACDQGRLGPCGPRRSGFVPPLRPEYFQSFLRTLPDVATFFTSFDEMDTARQQSVGTPEQLDMFAKLSHERVATADTDPSESPRQVRLDRVRISWLAGISRFYHKLALWTGLSAVLALLVAVVVLIRSRRLSFFAILGIGLLGSIGALVAAISMIQVTSFPAVNTGYFSGAYGLWLLFMFSGWLALTEAMPAGTREAGV
jgi:hypothetical protein